MKDQLRGKHTETLLFGLIFLLFPLAHLKISLGIFPIYLAEIPFLLALGVVIYNTRSGGLAQWKEYLRANKSFFVGAGLFLLGALLSFILNDKTLTGLGMLKSFFFLPVVLAVFLIVRPLASLKIILFLWLAGVVTVAWTSLFIAKEGFLTYDGRLAGLYESPNYLAMLLAPGVILALHFFFTFEKKTLKLGSALALLLISGALFLTQSYGALASIILTLLLFLCLLQCELTRWRNSVFVGALFLLVVLASSIWSTQKFQALFTLDERSSLASRFMIWESAIQISRDSFPWGIGPGNFQEKYLAYQQYYPPYLEWAVPQPHNLSLAFLLQTGLMGVIGFFLVIVTIIRGWYHRWKESLLSVEDRYVGAALFTLLIFYLCYGFIDTPYFKNDLAFALWGTIGLLFGWVNNRHNVH